MHKDLNSHLMCHNEVFKKGDNHIYREEMSGRWPLTHQLTGASFAAQRQPTNTCALGNAVMVAAVFLLLSLSLQLAKSSAGSSLAP